MWRKIKVSECKPFLEIGMKVKTNGVYKRIWLGDRVRDGIVHSINEELNEFTIKIDDKYIYLCSFDNKKVWIKIQESFFQKAKRLSKPMLGVLQTLSLVLTVRNKLR